MAKLRVDKIAAPIVKDEFTGSVFFDGNGDHLDVSSSSDFQFGAGDFNIEAWVYLVEAKDQAIFGTNNSADPNYEGYELDVFTNGSVRFYSGNGSAYNYGALGLESSAGVVPQRTWTHLDLSRQGNTLRLFVNGVLSVSNTSFSHTIEDSAVAPDIGNDGRSTGTSYHTHGYISNLRICKGHAVYTGNFTVPTRELEVHLGAKGVVFPAADNRTVLLACQSSTDATLDSSGRHTITVNGDPTAADANPGLFRKTNITSTITENTGSVYFDGTGDYLKIGESSDFTLGTDDFTVESWIYPTALNSVNTIIGHWDLSYTNNEWGYYLFSTNKIRVDTGLSSVLVSTTSVNLNEWTHIAYTRQSGTHKLYINGILDVSSSTAYDYSEVNSIGIGAYSNGANPFTGYISNLRICKGHAVYTGNFAPPTRELEVHPETVFLGLYDGENIFADKTGRHSIAAIGDRLSSPTPTATDSPIGITTNYPPVTRNVDPVEGPTFGGGVGFTSQNWLTLPKGTTTDRNPKLSNAVSHGSARGIFGAIQLYPNSSVTIHYSTIATFGNTVDFGDLNESRRYAAGCSSKTRGLFAGGSEAAPGPAKRNSIDYITIATTGNASDFGDLTQARWAPSAFSNATRGIWFSGNTTPANTNVIDYVTISTLGDALDFGDAFSDRRYPLGSTSDSTRGIDAGGHPASDNVIQYVTIASTGNAQDFGDLMQGIDGGCGGVSNGTRGVFAGGYTPTQVNTIQYITIQSMGNSKDFGDMTSTDARHGASAESSIRGLFTHGGYPSRLNTIDAITIATTGNAVEFGDIIDIGGNDGGGDSGTQSGFSNGHGGLG